jgi:hypothetical protein
MESEFPLDLLHRPIVLSSVSAKEVNGEGGMEDLITDGLKVHDGGHSLEMVKQMLAIKNVKKHMPFILLHSKNGKIPHKTLEAMIVAIQGGKQPKNKSALNFSGKFEWLKTHFKGRGFADKISYQEGQEKKFFPIDVQYILTLIAIVAHNHILVAENKKHQVNHSYLQKTGLLERYSNPKVLKAFQSITPILTDVLELRDFIEENIIEHLGQSISNKKYRNIVKVKSRGKFVSFFSNRDRKALVYSGILMPMIAPLAHFTTTNRDGDIVWKQNWNRNSIKEVYKKAIPEMVSDTVDLKDDATRVAKNPSHWSTLLKTIKNIADRMER